MIIGISGYKGAGKNEAARAVPSHRSLGFADPLKDFCGDVLGFTFEQLYGDKKEVIDQRYGKTPREALQTLGTDWGRAYYDRIWIDYGIQRAFAVLASGVPNVVITDVRFKNEVDAIKNAGGEVWRVVRPNNPYSTGDTHASETELSDTDSCFDVFIMNDGDKGKLWEAVRTACRGFR